MEEPGRLQSMGSLGVGHDWATSLSLFTFMHRRRKWQPTPVFLPVGFLHSVFYLLLLLCWVFVAVWGLSLVAAVGGCSPVVVWASHWSGFSCRGAQAQLPCGPWNLPGPGIGPVPPVLAGEFFTTGPPVESFSILITSLLNWDLVDWKMSVLLFVLSREFSWSFSWEWLLCFFILFVFLRLWV